jgi:hypothetical protein
VNGAPPPFDVRNDATGRVTITEGTLTLGSGTFQQSITLSEARADSTASLRQSATAGTFTVTASRIQFRAADGGQWEGTYDTNRVDYTVPGNNGSIAFSFRRG